MFARSIDQEYEQSIVRLLLGGVVMIYLLCFAALQSWMIPSFLGFILVSLAIIYSINCVPGDYPWRKIFGQLVDIGSVSILLFFCGKVAVPVAGVYLWVSVGNGCRFGTPYLLSATALSTICFIYIALHQPYWLEYRNFAVGIGIPLFIVPLYFAALLSRLNATRKQLELLSYKDELTGLFNRRSFDDKIRLEVSRLKRFPASFSVAIVDIDHFKGVNDTYGHLVGDIVLKNVAKVLKKTCRDMDVVARYGGEEFALLLPGLSKSEKQAFGERLRRAVEKSPVILNGNSIRVTVSIGMSCWNTSYSSAEDWLLQADNALYQAKDQGRNRVVVAEPLNTPPIYSI